MKTAPLLAVLAWLFVPRAVPATEITDEAALGNPRELPSLEIAWRQGRRPVVYVEVEDGVVYAAGYRSLAAYDAATVVTTSRGPLGGQGDTVVVRQIGSRWVVRRIEHWWIS